MIMPKSSDLLTTGFCPQAKLRLAYVEVTDSARALEQSHLAGPTAGLALAEALAGVALLSADLDAADETVVLRMQVSGPLQGLLVEASADGSLRGYTNVKVINDLDSRDELAVSEAYGDRGDVQIIRAVPGRIVGRAAFAVAPVSAPMAVEEYFVRSLQRPAIVQIAALAYGGSIDLARGVVIERMPDGDRAEFERIAGLVADGTVLESLETSLAFQEWCETIGLADVRLADPKPLMFRCRCTRERVESMVGALSVGELTEMVHEGHAAQIYCHMCGKGYEVPVEWLMALLQGKQRGENP